jgi:hypothetical protein
MAIDISQFSFDDLVTLIFDHPVSEESWYLTDEWVYGNNPDWHDYYAGDKGLLLRNLTRLFRSPAFLFDKYSLEQLEQGFWFIPGQLLCVAGFSGPLWDAEIEWADRKDCIESMGDLFEHFFAVNSLQLSCHMWWDSLAYGYHREPSPEEDSEAEKVQQVMFETLCRILRIESEECQSSALHGLGHLNHPKTKMVIDEFLLAHPSVNDDLRKYALACKDGNIM